MIEEGIQRESGTIFRTVACSSVQDRKIWKRESEKIMDPIKQSFSDDSTISCIAERWKEQLASRIKLIILQKSLNLFSH